MKAMKKIKEQHGITLVALVVTIVVLLILSGVTITNVISDDGIISKAEQAVNKTKRATIIESIAMDILTEQMDGGSITESMLEEILEQYGEVQYDDNDGSITGVLPDDLNEVIDIADLYSGTLATEQETISTTESYVGCYADLDPTDGKIDGIIYVDLMQEQSADYWYSSSTGTYSWTPLTETDGVKDYYVSQESYTDDFGTAKVISPVDVNSTETDRFYVMALDDVDSSYHYWYYNAYGKMTDYATATSGDFGTGYKNTGAMITKWKGGASTGYGEGTTTGSYPDMWGLEAVQTGYENGWFVPSRAEWSAFAVELEITKTNYGSFGLSYYYWSSSPYDTYGAYYALIYGGMIDGDLVNAGYYVRLSATF